MKESAKVKMGVHNRRRLGLSMVEVMAGVIIFTLIFIFVFRAFAPTATTSHSVLRGTTIAMNACNWYLNDLERAIQAEGALDSSDLGTKDITSRFTESEFSDIKLLRSLQATSEIKLENNLYTAKISFRWSNSEKDNNRPHHFEMFRLIVQPAF